METLGSRLERSRKDLVEQGSQLWGQTMSASRGFASFVHGEARDWSAYIKERAATDLRVERLRVGATDLLGRIAGGSRRSVEEEETAADAEDAARRDEPTAEGEPVES